MHLVDGGHYTLWMEDITPCGFQVALINNPLQTIEPTSIFFNLPGQIKKRKMWKEVGFWFFKSANLIFKNFDKNLAISNLKFQVI
jgi:hypothetical protein